MPGVLILLRQAHERGSLRVAAGRGRVNERKVDPVNPRERRDRKGYFAFTGKHQVGISRRRHRALPSLVGRYAGPCRPLSLDSADQACLGAQFSAVERGCASENERSESLEAEFDGLADELSQAKLSCSRPRAT